MGEGWDTVLEGGGKPHCLGRGSQEQCLGKDVEKGHGKIYLLEIGGGAEWRHSDQWELACLEPPSQGGLLSLSFPCS